MYNEIARFHDSSLFQQARSWIYYPSYHLIQLYLQDLLNILALVFRQGLQNHILLIYHKFQGSFQKKIIFFYMDEDLIYILLYGWFFFKCFNMLIIFFGFNLYSSIWMVFFKCFNMLIIFFQFLLYFLISSTID